MVTSRGLMVSVKVKVPAAARFKWTNYADVGLFGINDMPLPPFRTDKYND